MKKFMIIFILILASIFFSNQILSDTSELTFENLNPENQHKRASQLIAHILTSTHYQKRSIDDSNFTFYNLILLILMNTVLILTILLKTDSFLSPMIYLIYIKNG